MKELRESFGISQEQFAVYLGVPRSQVALAETNARTYQTKAMLKAAKLFTLLENKTLQPQIALHNQQQTEPLNKALQERIDECRFQLMVANKKMATIKQQYEQCCNGFQLVNDMKATPNEEKTEREKNLEDWIEMSLTVKLRKCGLQAQELLQLEIDVLEFEVSKALKRMMAV